VPIVKHSVYPCSLYQVVRSKYLFLFMWFILDTAPLPPGRPNKSDSSDTLYLLKSYFRTCHVVHNHKNYLPRCPVNYSFLIMHNYSFLIPHLKHSYDCMFHFPYLREGMESSTSLVRCYVDYIFFIAQLTLHVHKGPPTFTPAHEALAT
jgi:hypothetical protein